MALRGKIQGNELDLSLNQLTEVPVKELANAVKATNVDLSCNLIERLPEEIGSLTHLVKLDLSKNKITELPPSFGNLKNLEYLDLYANEIVDLPISFYRLKKLSWLDLKNNPLCDELKAIAGDCLDDRQCRVCATKVVAYMKAKNARFESQRQKQLQEEKEKRAIKQAEVERLLEEERKAKKIMREKRKAELKAKRDLPETEVNRSYEPSPLADANEKKFERKDNHFRFLSISVVTVLAAAVLIWICMNSELVSTCSSVLDNENAKKILDHLKKTSSNFRSVLPESFQDFTHQFGHFFKLLYIAIK
ncbi:hypothetical protein X975_13772, partial [Stegodyphus mimosarum]